MPIRLIPHNGAEAVVPGNGPLRLASLQGTGEAWVAIQEGGGRILLEDDNGLLLEAIDVNPWGRDPIGVSQPPGTGYDFPFIWPSTDIQYLLADACLIYDDEHDYHPLSAPELVLPFRVAWLYGCGTRENTPPEGSPTPIHDADILIVDANGTTVFDSTTSDPKDAFTARDWTDRLRIYEWRKEWATMRIVTHTAWPPVSSPEPREYDLYLSPESAILDPRAVFRLPKRVRSLTVVLERITDARIVNFQNGYNTTIAHTGTATAPGRRWVEQVTFGAAAGSGDGRYPGCEVQPLVIRRINEIGPNTQGNFFWAATDCYWVRRPTRIASDVPLLLVPTLPTIDPTLTDLEIAELYPTVMEHKWPHSRNEAHLQVGSDCKPCCDCPQYVDVARYLIETRNRYAALGREAEEVRDLYAANRARWLASRTCFHRRPLRLFMQPQRCPFMDVVIMFCNQSDRCVREVELMVHFDGPNATVLPGFTFITGAKTSPGRISAETEYYDMLGAYPTLGAFWDAVQPAQSVSAKFRLDFGNCDDPAVITGTLTGTARGEPILVDMKPPKVGKERAKDVKTRALRCPPDYNYYDIGTRCTPKE